MEISKGLRLTLSDEEKKQLTKHYTEDAAALQRYWEGRFFFDKRTVDGVRQSRLYFQQAIKRDSNFALAYAGLANSYTPSDLVLAPADLETMRQARTAATKALEIDDQLAEAYTAQARVLMFYDLDWQGAEDDLKRAMELDRGYAEAHHIYSHYLMYVGRTQESLSEALQAWQIDRFNILLTVHLGWTYLYARQYDQAIEQLRRAIEMDGSFFRAHLFLARAYEQKKMYIQARAAYEKARELEVDSNESIVMLGHLAAVSGNKAEAFSAIESLADLYKQKRVSAYDLAIIYAGLNQNGAALDWIEKAYQERTGGVLMLKSEPIFDNLRAEPRYRDLLRRMNLTR